MLSDYMKYCKDAELQNMEWWSHDFTSYHFTGCSPRDLWDLSAADATFLSDVSLLEDAAQYLSCDDGSVGSVVLNDNRLNTATVAYYNGATPGSTACFVCDRSSGYELNATTTAERVCQSDGLWSGSPIVCGMS